MGAGHVHGAGANQRALRWALALTGGFMLTEVDGRRRALLVTAAERIPLWHCSILRAISRTFQRACSGGGGAQTTATMCCVCLG